MMQQPGTTMVPPQQQPPYLQPDYQQQPATGYYPPQHQYGQTQPTTHDDGVRSLWIGDLQIWMDETYLYNCFATAGDVVSAKVIRNKLTGQPGGYGFIEFANHAAAERCLTTYNGTKMPSAEQAFKLNWASMGAGEKRADSPEYTIFVGDLAAEVTDYMLQETFRANYPSVKGAKVVTDQVTGRTKGYGFVRFSDESEQLRAMTEMNGQYCSTRPMRVGPAANKQKVQTQASYQTQGTASEDDPNNTTVFVGNLDPSVAEEHLRQIFGQFGQLQHVKIPLGKRCGFVQFVDRGCAEESLRLLNGTQLAGQNIRLSWGRSPANKPADSTQYNNGGYYGYNPGYENYGYAPPAAAAAAQDPNMYYTGYPGYGNYPPAQQQLPQ